VEASEFNLRHYLLFVNGNGLFKRIRNICKILLIKLAEIIKNALVITTQRERLENLTELVIES